MPSEKKDHFFSLSLTRKFNFFPHRSESQISDYLIPINGKKQGNVGNKQKDSPNGIQKTHDGGDAAVDFVAKHVENDAGADDDIDGYDNDVNCGNYC
jgi:hypothetical protein